MPGTAYVIVWLICGCSLGRRIEPQYTPNGYPDSPRELGVTRPGSRTAAAAPQRFLGDAQQVSQQPSPRQLSRPSLTATAAITSAAAGSAHHRPHTAFSSSPTNSATDK